VLLSWGFLGRRSLHALSSLVTGRSDARCAFLAPVEAIKDSIGLLEDRIINFLAALKALSVSGLELGELLSAMLLDPLVEAVVLIENDAALLDLDFKDGELAGGSLGSSAILDTALALGFSGRCVERFPLSVLSLASLADLHPLSEVVLSQRGVPEEQLLESVKVHLTLRRLSLLFVKSEGEEAGAG